MISLEIGGLDVSSLDAEFTIRADRTSKPNTAEILVYGASESTRSSWSAAKAGVNVVLRAGYAHLLPLPVLCKGQLRFISHKHTDAEWVSSISSGDGDQGLAHISTTLAAGSTLAAALKRIAGEMGVGAKAMIESLPFGSGKLVTGLTMHGRSMDELERLVRAQGYDVHVSNGELKIETQEVDARSPVEVSQATGLVGSPEFSENHQAVTSSVGTKGKVKYRTIKFVHLLSPALVPGQSVHIGDAFARIEEIEYRGETNGPDWYATCTCRLT